MEKLQVSKSNHKFFLCAVGNRKKIGIFILIAACKEVWGVFDMTNKGTVDAFIVGDMLRAMKFKPTNAQIKKFGGVDKAGEKQLKFEEFLPIYKELSKIKDTGSYADFMEAFNVYDKEGNGSMLGAELRHLMMSLGEKLTAQQADSIMKACATEDAEGMVKYESEYI